MTLHRIADYLRWLGKLPHPRDLWTYCGVWILDGVVASLLYRLAFVHVLDATLAGAFAAMFAVSLVAFLLHKMGFAALYAIIISGGGMCVAAANWITIHIDLTTRTYVVLTLGGLIVSLPLFCRGMEIIRPKIE